MSSDSEISVDDGLLMETLPSNNDILHDCRYDPKQEVSDHEDDDEPSMAGYGSSDTDNESDNFNYVDSLPNSVDDWCSCGTCKDMPTSIERYCCRDITLVHENLLNVNVNGQRCVCETDVFRGAIENHEVLEMCAFANNKKVPTDKECRIEPAGLRYTAYRCFLNICRIRYVGKGHRYALPACVVTRIRELYPSKDGIYVDFEATEFVSRIN
jgi:hypothetical protein